MVCDPFFCLNSEIATKNRGHAAISRHDRYGFEADALCFSSFLIKGRNGALCLVLFSRPKPLSSKMGKTARPSQLTVVCSCLSENSVK